jgi:hypothetical protein
MGQLMLNLGYLVVNTLQLVYFVPCVIWWRRIDYMACRFPLLGTCYQGWHDAVFASSEQIAKRRAVRRTGT